MIETVLFSHKKIKTAYIGYAKANQLNLIMHLLTITYIVTR